MGKIKLTKSELKKQRDSLKQFLHYLPTLQLKKQQLQMHIFEIRKIFKQKQEQRQTAQEELKQWIRLLADPGIDIFPWIVPKEIRTKIENIAGSDIPVLDRIVYREIDYDLYAMPFWVDRAILKLRAYATLMVEARILEKEMAILGRELMVTTQRVNLFEKVKIPGCVESIRKIRIYLGDQLANAVGVSKVAKKKIENALLAGLSA
jgi:V/A-type H+/Na+-transporting ATPase subunit D